MARALFLTRGPALLPPIPCPFHPAVILVTASSRGTHQPPQFCVSVEIHLLPLSLCLRRDPPELLISVFQTSPLSPMWSCREYWDPQGHQLFLPVTHVAPQPFLQWFSSLCTHDLCTSLTKLPPSLMHEVFSILLYHSTGPSWEAPKELPMVAPWLHNPFYFVQEMPSLCQAQQQP